MPRELSIQLEELKRVVTKLSKGEWQTEGPPVDPHGEGYDLYRVFKLLEKIAWDKGWEQDFPQKAELAVYFLRYSLAMRNEAARDPGPYRRLTRGEGDKEHWKVVLKELNDFFKKQKK